jgi:hypothetical protein
LVRAMGVEMRRIYPWFFYFALNATEKCCYAVTTGLV